MKKFSFDINTNQFAKNQDLPKKASIGRQIKLNATSQNILNSSVGQNNTSKYHQQSSPNLKQKLKLDIYTQLISNDKKQENNSKSPILQQQLSNFKQNPYQYSISQKKQSLDSLIGIKNHLSPNLVKTKNSSNLFFGETINSHKDDQKRMNSLGVARGSLQFNESYTHKNIGQQIGYLNSPDFHQFNDYSLQEEKQSPNAYLHQTYKQPQAKMNANIQQQQANMQQQQQQLSSQQISSQHLKKRLSYPIMTPKQQNIQIIAPPEEQQASPSKQITTNTTFQLPYIAASANYKIQLENNIQKNKQVIKQMTQDLIINNKGTLMIPQANSAQKRKKSNKSMQFLESFETKAIPASSLVNIKESEFASPNSSLKTTKKHASMNTLNKIPLNDIKDNNKVANFRPAQTTLIQIQDDIEEDPQANGKSKHLQTDSKLLQTDSVHFWQYKEKTSQNKDKNYKKIRQLNLQESLQKFELTSQKLGVSSRLNLTTEELRSPHQNANGSDSGQQYLLQNEKQQLDYSKYLDTTSPQKMKEGSVKMKKKDEQEEAKVLSNQIACEAVAQTIMEKIIEELSTEDSDLKATVHVSMSSNNAYNLGFILKKYFLFCLEKVVEEFKFNHSCMNTARQQHKMRKERKSEDLDSSLQNLVLSELFLEKSKELISHILFHVGVDFDFIKELHKIYDEYGKFFIPQNNIKRIGLQNIETILNRLLKELVDNHLIDKEILEATANSPAARVSRPNYYLEDIKRKMLEFSINLLNEHNESIFMQISEFQEHQQIQTFEYFMIKIILLNIMREMNLEWVHINVILEKMENIRLLFFREVKSSSINLFFDKKENHPSVKQHIMRNKFLIECIGEANLDGFIKFLDQFIMGYRDYSNLKKYLNPKINFSKDFAFRFGQELNEIIPEEVVRRETMILDIKHQFAKILQTINLSNKEKQIPQQQQQQQSDRFSQNNNHQVLNQQQQQLTQDESTQFFKRLESINIQDIIYKLVDLVEYKIVTGEIPSEITEQDILVNSKFLDYFLHFTFQNKGFSFSYYDLEMAFSYYKMNSFKAFEYWIQNICIIINENYPQIKEFHLLKYLSQFMLSSS